jgi:hypothetical protein
MNNKGYDTTAKIVDPTEVISLETVETESDMLITERNALYMERVNRTRNEFNEFRKQIQNEYDEYCIQKGVKSHDLFKLSDILSLNEENLRVYQGLLTDFSSRVISFMFSQYLLSASNMVSTITSPDLLLNPDQSPEYKFLLFNQLNAVIKQFLEFYNNFQEMFDSLDATTAVNKQPVIDNKTFVELLNSFKSVLDE